jgi:hypothetical protein
MYKNGYLKDEDFIGTGNYMDANGDISEGTTILLRKFNFAGFTLLDVEAFVVHELSAPLLLGQSALAKLGTFQMDPNSGTLIILKKSGESHASVSAPKSNYSSQNTNNNAPNTEPFDFSKLPKYTGTVKVYSNSPIYAKPDIVNSKEIGAAKGGSVKIIRNENLKYYYVQCGDVKGYLYVGSIKKISIKVHRDCAFSI